jgi:hypothetical protein
MNKICKFLLWPSSDKRLLLEAFLMVIGVRIALSIFPYKKLSCGLCYLTTGMAKQSTNPELIKKVAKFVLESGRYIPYASCLTQALTASTILRRHGQDSSLKIGVDKDGSGRLVAHAWIEVDGKTILGKVPDIRRYAVMSHGTELLV